MALRNRLLRGLPDGVLVHATLPVNAELRGGQDIHEALLQSATDAARMLSRKEISSRELTEELLARIDSVNPALNAVVELRVTADAAYGTRENVRP